jgi:hypothetical protein
MTRGKPIKKTDGERWAPQYVPATPERRVVPVAPERRVGQPERELVPAGTTTGDAGGA